MQPRSLPTRWYVSTSCYISSTSIGKSVHLLFRHTVYMYFCLLGCDRGKGGKLVRGETRHAPPSKFCQLQKGPVTEGVNVFRAWWMFVKRYTAAWPFWWEPSSDQAVLPAAVSVSGSLARQLCAHHWTRVGTRLQCQFEDMLWCQNTKSYTSQSCIESIPSMKSAGTMKICSTLKDITFCNVCQYV
jgi:hypothetical protein